jgi:hypothetical protein
LEFGTVRCKSEAAGMDRSAVVGGGALIEHVYKAGTHARTVGPEEPSKFRMIHKQRTKEQTEQNY